MRNLYFVFMVLFTALSFNLNANAQGTEPCEGNPPAFSIGYECNTTASGAFTGTAGLALEALNGNGTLSYYNAMTGYPVSSGMTLNDGEELGVYALDEEGCKAFTQTIVVNCPSTIDPCDVTPAAFDISYDCITDGNGNLTGQANLSLVQTSGTGTMNFYNSMTGYPVLNSTVLSDGETLNVYGLDEMGCKALTQTITVDCPGVTIPTDPCEDNPASFTITYECMTDALGNLTGQASLSLVQTGGTGVLNYYNAMTGYPVMSGMTLENGQSLGVYGLDEAGCKALTQTINVNCEATAPGGNPCADNPPAFDMSYTCITDANGNLTGEATLSLTQLGGIGVLNFYDSMTGLPVLNGMILSNGTSLGVYALDEIGCKAMTQSIFVNCPGVTPPADPCEENPAAFTISYSCVTDANGNLTGQATLSLTQTGGTGALNYYNAMTGYPVMDGMTLSDGQSLGVYGLDAEGCKALTQTINVSCTAAPTDPCEDNPAAFTISYSCVTNASGALTGQATLSLTQTGGTGVLSYYNAMTGYPVMSGMTLENGQSLGVYGLDEAGCKALTQTIVVDCPSMLDPCDENPAAFTISYSCVTDAEGNNTGQATLNLTQTGGTGTVSFYNAMTGYPVMNGMTLNDGESLGVYGLDEMGCKALTQTINVDCASTGGATGDPCEDNPPSFMVSYECIMDASGTPTGQAIISIEQLAGDPLSYYNAITGYPVNDGMILDAGEEINIYGLDEAGCKAFGNPVINDCEGDGFTSGGGGAQSSINFAGIASDKGNVLFVAPTEEDVNEYYIVEKSVDGVNFESIGIIYNDGNTDKYEYLDQASEEGEAHYRLREGDFGSYKYSNIVSLDRVKASFDFNYVLPIPTRGYLEIAYVTSNSTPIEISIYDLSGRTVFSEYVTSNQGDNMFSMDISELSSATYLLQLNNGEKVISCKIVKE